MMAHKSYVIITKQNITQNNRTLNLQVLEWRESHKSLGIYLWNHITAYKPAKSLEYSTLHLLTSPWTSCTLTELWDLGRQNPFLLHVLLQVFRTRILDERERGGGGGGGGGDALTKPTKKQQQQQNKKYILTVLLDVSIPWDRFF